MRASTPRLLLLIVLLPVAVLSGGCAMAGLPLLLMLVKDDPSRVGPARPAVAPGAVPVLPSATTPLPATPGDSVVLVSG